jgi:hypothetical protein
MRLPVLQGLIRRRLLVNFRVDSTVMQGQLPSCFTPKLHAGHAIAGICLIRLEQVRPRLAPRVLGLASENAAHRVAVRWTDASGAAKEGVFVPRRDTGSLLNHLAGGKLFPGEHNRATFDVREDDASIDLRMRSHDGAVAVSVRGRYGAGLPSTSCFASLEEASRFFEGGATGYSVTRDPGRLDGLELRTEGWRVEALDVEDVQSSWFADRARFPEGSVTFDCALAMRDLPHTWHAVDDLHA